MSSTEYRRGRRYSLRSTLGLRLGLTVALAMGGLFALIDHWVDTELYRRFDAALAPAPRRWGCIWGRRAAARGHRSRP